MIKYRDFEVTDDGYFQFNQWVDKVKEKPNDGHWHEVMDRIFIIQNNIEDYLENSLPAENDECFRSLVMAGQSILSQAYQRAGAMSDESQSN